MFFVKLKLNDVSGNKGCLVLLVAELAPVDAGEPGVLLHFTDALRPLCWVLLQQAVEEIAEEQLTSSVSLDSNHAQVRFIL